jgi:hypothetical protein
MLEAEANRYPDLSIWFRLASACSIRAIARTTGAGYAAVLPARQLRRDQP